MTEENKLISFPPAINQIELRKLAMFCSSYLGNDLYFLNEFNMIALSTFKEMKSEKWIEENFKGYEQIKPKLRKLGKRINEAKAYYDAIEDKRFEKKDKETEIKRAWLYKIRPIALVQQEIFDLMVFIIMNTSLQRQSMKSDSFKIDVLFKLNIIYYYL